VCALLRSLQHVWRCSQDVSNTLWALATLRRQLRPPARAAAAAAAAPAPAPAKGHGPASAAGSERVAAVELRAARRGGTASAASGDDAADDNDNAPRLPARWWHDPLGGDPPPPPPQEQPPPQQQEQQLRACTALPLLADSLDGAHVPTAARDSLSGRFDAALAEAGAALLARSTGLLSGGGPQVKWVFFARLCSLLLARHCLCRPM
jgi:hypothetical protein